jgi:hypothetical protein
MPVIPGFGRLRKEDLQFIVKTYEHSEDPVSKTKTP